MTDCLGLSVCLPVSVSVSELRSHPPHPRKLNPGFLKTPCPQISMLWDMNWVGIFLLNPSVDPKSWSTLKLRGQGVDKTGIKFSGALVSSTLDFEKKSFTRA